MPDRVVSTPPPTGQDGEFYAVSVRGRLGESLRGAFSPLVATVAGGVTVLSGPIEDQAALHGVLAKVQALGLELDEVRHLPENLADPIH